MKVMQYSVAAQAARPLLEVTGGAPLQVISCYEKLYSYKYSHPESSLSIRNKRIKPLPPGLYPTSVWEKQRSKIFPCTRILQHQLFRSQTGRKSPSLCQLLLSLFTARLPHSIQHTTFTCHLPAPKKHCFVENHWSREPHARTQERRAASNFSHSFSRPCIMLLRWLLNGSCTWDHIKSSTASIWVPGNADCTGPRQEPGILNEAR